MIELFDPKFVHFMWDDKLEGKKVFLANHIGALRSYVRKGDERYFEVEKTNDVDEPFQAKDGINFTFAYYDPNYEAKKAFNEGKKVQILLAGGVDWRDVEDEAALERYIEEGRRFRVKSEEEKWIAYLARSKNSDYLTAGRADRWESIQKEYGAKTKLFIGAYDEAVKWYDARQKFAETVKAWEDGKKIQVTPKGTDKWVDLHCEPTWDLRDEYRVKPENEDESCIVYLQRYDEECWLSVCYECEWNEVQKNNGAKTKLFVGSEDEVKEWYESRRKFAKVIRAWEDGKKIQVYDGVMSGGWVDVSNPRWDFTVGYRIKPDCPCEDGIDSKACVGCEHSEDGKPEEKKYRPYENSAEMIADFIDRFKVDCPSYAEPSIWVKGQSTDNRYLATGIFPEDGVHLGGRHYSFTELFSCYTYFNGSPCGMEVKE